MQRSTLVCVVFLFACSTPDDPGNADSALADGGTAIDSGRDGATANDTGAVGVDVGVGADVGTCAMPDHDGDGERSTACGGLDCNDMDPAAFPGRTEVCDTAGHDEDCDPGTFGFRDADSDGFPDGACCNVDSAGTHHCGTDCNDSAPGVHPTATEVCNGTDDDCDMAIDEGVTTTYHHDADGDGYGGIAGVTMAACTPPSGYVLDATDCDDTNMSVHPGATEVCNMGVDDNCDLVADPGCACATGAMRDCGTPNPLGGFLTVGICTMGTQHCMGGLWEAGCMGATPPTTESCNGADDDCDTRTDEGTGLNCYVDGDRDGFAASGASASMACVCPGGSTATAPVGGAIDCDDANASRNPATTESCNGIDDNCNGSIDEGTLSTYYGDCDSDGYGGSMSMAACSAPPGIPTGCSAGTWNSTGGDCDDTQATVHPTASEICNHRDDDCNGTIDGSPASMACTTAEPSGVASSVCTAGTCAVATCNTGRYDCNGGSDCEVSCSGCPGSCPWVCAHGNCADAPSELAASSDEVCAIVSGHVVCWGNDGVGETGDGGPTGGEHPTPVRVAGLTDAIDIALGSFFGCAARASGGVVCWGGNFYGNLGDGMTVHTDPCGECVESPVNVVGITDAIQVAATAFTACALHSGGTVSCWGSDERGELGNGSGARSGGCAYTTNCSVTPVDVSGLTDAVELVGGTGNTDGGHFCARRAGGSIVCWGYNPLGELGNGATGNQTAPVAVMTITDATHIAAGGHHTCAIRGTGTVSCWGDNRDGQISVNGAGMTGSSMTPRAVPGVSDAVEIAAGGENTCVRRTGGSMVCWGDNMTGQIGDNTTTDRNVPTAVMGITGASHPAVGGSSPTGGGTVCAVQNGAVECWGNDTSGQAGDGHAADVACGAGGMCVMAPTYVTAPP